MKNFKVMLGFDMETDVGSWSSEEKGVREGTPIITDILKTYDAEATFFWVGVTAQRNPEIVKETAGYGELGFHSMFHETVGEPLFPIPGVYPVLPEELENRLVKTRDMVRDAAGGIRPTSFRAPRLFGGTHMINVLEKMDCIADASYPMYFYRDRLNPYHPSKEDWTKEGDLKIVEIPNFADLGMESGDEYGRDRDQWPLWRTENAVALFEHVRSYLSYADGKGIENPVLSFYFHPWEFVEMPQGDIRSGEGIVRPDPFITFNTGRYAVEQFKVLMDLLLEEGAEFTTCEKIAKEYS